MTEIIDSDELNEREAEGLPGFAGADNGSGQLEYEASLSATTEATDAQLEFHVQMKNWTLREMEVLVVEAAARQVLGKFSEGYLAKLIQDRAIELVTAKADAILEKVTAEIIDQPLADKYGKEPVTMREFIGLYPREYLQQRVDVDGKPSRDPYYGKARVVRIVEQTLDSGFDKALKDARNKMLDEIRAAYQAKYSEVVEEAKGLLYKALEHTFKPKDKS